MSEMTRTTSESVCSRDTTDVQFLFNKYDQERIEKERLKVQNADYKTKLDEYEKLIKQYSNMRYNLHAMATKALYTKSITKDMLLDIIATIADKLEEI